MKLISNWNRCLTDIDTWCYRSAEQVRPGFEASSSATVNSYIRWDDVRSLPATTTAASAAATPSHLCANGISTFIWVGFLLTSFRNLSETPSNQYEHTSFKVDKTVYVCRRSFKRRNNMGEQLVGTLADILTFEQLWLVGWLSSCVTGRLTS